MAADVVGNKILTAQGRELITIMDDYATEFQLYVAISDTANRATLISNALTQQSANQTALEAYATAHNIDLTAQKTAGIAKKQAVAAANGITLTS
jgi:hypothetical protein